MERKPTKSTPQWIHEPSDGRGPRRVTVDGVEIGRVVYADERRGFVRFLEDPPQVDARCEFIERTRHGKVEVHPISERGQ